MRIGTWNLEGKWSSDHLAFLEGQERDGGHLTDMPSEASIPDTTAHRTVRARCPRKTWAGIFSSRDLTMNQALEGRERPSVHRPVLAVDTEVLALGLLATSDGGAT